MRGVSSAHLVRGVLLAASLLARPAHAAPALNAIALHEEGVRLSKGNLPREAVAFLEKAVKADPAFAEAWADLGSAHLALNIPTEAVPALEMAVALKPDLHIARYNLAFALRKLGSHGQAAAQYRIYLQKEPEDADAQYGLAEALRAAGDRAAAAEAYELYATVEKRPEQTRWIAQAKAHAVMLRDQVAEEARARATAMQSEAAARAADDEIPPKPAPPPIRPPPVPDDPDNPKQSFQYGLHLLEIGKYEKALPFLERASAAAPDAPLILGALGAAHLGLKQGPEAEAAYRRALSTATPELEANLWFGLGEALRLRGQRKNARLAFERAGGLATALPMVRRLAAERAAVLADD